MPPNATLKYVVSSALLLGAACGPSEPSEPDNVNTVAPETEQTATQEGTAEVETPEPVGQIEPINANPRPPEPPVGTPTPELPEETAPPTGTDEATDGVDPAPVEALRGIVEPRHTTNPVAPTPMRAVPPTVDPARLVEPVPEISVNPAAPLLDE